MKSLLIILSTFLFTAAAYSQNPDKALVKVQYNFIHVRDTTQKDKPYTENMILIAGKNASMYTSFDRWNMSINGFLKRQELEKQGLPRDQIYAQMTSLFKNTASNMQYYFFAKEHTFFSREEINRMYLVEDAIPAIDWKISKDTLNFSGIHCQKALATFKGRNWIAWFATELPFESGPWKLNGLPGLIIEAYDDKKEVEFKFAGVGKIKSGDLITENANNLPDVWKNLLAVDISEVAIHFDQNNIKTTRKEFDKLKALHDKDPLAFGGNGGGGGGGGGRGGGGDVASGAPTPQRIPVATPVVPVIVINNPIELTQ